ncbi:hypothetical protein B484DRAFT_465347, partial [Ochromonadaceae sp. CCMP2298]
GAAGNAGGAGGVWDGCGEGGGLQLGKVPIHLAPPSAPLPLTQGGTAGEFVRNALAQEQGCNNELAHYRCGAAAHHCAGSAPGRTRPTAGHSIPGGAGVQCTSTRKPLPGMRKHSYTHTLIHIHSYTHTLIHIHSYTHTLIHSYTYTHTLIHSYTHTHTHTLIHSYTHTLLHSYTHTLIYSYTH